MLGFPLESSVKSIFFLICTMSSLSSSSLQITFSFCASKKINFFFQVRNECFHSNALCAFVFFVVIFFYLHFFLQCFFSLFFFWLTFLTLKLLILYFSPATSFLICLMGIFCSTIIFSFSFTSSSVFSLNNGCASLILYLLSFSQGRDNVKMFLK